MTRAEEEILLQTRRAMIRNGVVAGGGIAAYITGLRTAAAYTTDPEADPEADPVAEETPDGTPLGESGDVVIYSGRNEELIGPAIEMAEEAEGIEAEVRYGGTAEMAATLLEEGENTPASLYIAQDAGALGQLASEGLMAELPQEILDRVDPRFRSPDGLWVGLSGRARVLVYNTEMIGEGELPASVKDLTGEEWTDKVGWAPENGSFQAFVTAFRVLEGDDAAREWLQTMIENGAVTYESNGAITRAVGAGEIPVGLVNHYYRYEVEKEDEVDLPIENHFFESGDPGSLVNVAGAGVLANGPDQDQAIAMLDAFLSEPVQSYFSDTTFEYPLIEGVEPAEGLRPLAEIDSPDIDLSDLDDLQGTLEMLAEVGAI